MANVWEFDEGDEEKFKEWAASRPEPLPGIILKYPPNRLYRLKDTGDRGTISAYAEDGTVRVAITAEFNRTLFERDVFGIDPNLLEECDLPGDDEELGAAMTQEDVEENIDALRCLIRPDLFVMDKEGKAVRKN